MASYKDENLSAAKRRKLLEEKIFNNIIYAFNKTIAPEIKRIMKECAMEEIFSYSPVRYKRRNNGIASDENLEVYLQNDRIVFLDLTPPNRSIFGGELPDDVTLAGLISGIPNIDGTQEDYIGGKGVIPTLPLNSNIEYPWSRPNYRPYLQKTEQIVSSASFNKWMSDVIVSHFKKNFK